MQEAIGLEVYLKSRDLLLIGRVKKMRRDDFLDSISRSTVLIAFSWMKITKKKSRNKKKNFDWSEKFRKISIREIEQKLKNSLIFFFKLAGKV